MPKYVIMVRPKAKDASISASPMLVCDTRKEAVTFMGNFSIDTTQFDAYVEEVPYITQNNQERNAVE